MTAPRAYPLVAVPVVAALAAATAAGLIRGGDTVDAFEYALSLLAAIAAVGVALTVRPAWPLSIGLALTVFSGNWDTLGLPIPFDRLLIVTGIVSALARARLRDRDALRTRPIDWLLVAVATYGIVSAVLAGTLDDDPLARFALIDRYSLFGFVIFFAAPLAFAEERDRRILMATLTVTGAYLGLTALFETIDVDALVLPDYISDPAVGRHFGRARGPFAEAAANGLMLFMCGVAAAIAAVTWRDLRRRVLAGAVVALCALGVLLTVTRAAWLAAGVGGIVALLAYSGTRRYVVYVVVASALGVLGAFAVVPNLRQQAEQRVDDDWPLWDRRNSNAAALRMLADRPVLGFGWGRFPYDSEDYYRQSPDYPLTFVREVHSVFLNIAVELGLLGALLWFGAAVTVAVGAVGRRGPPSLGPWKVGFIGLVVAYAVVATTSPLAFAGPTLLLWAWAGVAWGLARTERL